MTRMRWLKYLVPLLLFVLMFSTVSPAQTAPNGEKARVWVQFEKGYKGPVAAALKLGGAEFHYVFDDLSAFVVSVPQQALDGIAHNPHVTLVEEDAPRFALGQETPYGITMVQAPDVWATGATGAGRMVCIIDSGLYTIHEDIKGLNITGGYPSNWATDTCGHGTHVAGTIGALNNSVGVVGVAKPDLYIVKVFGDNCAWTYSSTLVDAANRCKAAGANIISMSLGGSTKSTLEQNAFASLDSAGILSIAAAGNDGTTAVSYPAGYASVMSVAAIDSNKTVASFSQKNSDVEIAAPGVGVLSTVPFIATDTVTVGNTTVKGVHVEYAAYTNGISGTMVGGGECTATSTGYSGKIVLCDRGTISFYDKVMNVQNSGGIGVIIADNVAGETPNFTLGDGNSSTIPAIGVTLEDGTLLKGFLGSSANLVSQVVWNANGYEAWDGTSMATPHVSGVAALIWSANPNWTNQQIRDAMDKTAQDLGAAGRDTSYGYGLVQAKAALDYLKGSSAGGTLVVTVATDKASYVNKEKVTITVTVKDGKGMAVSGASVTNKITTAKGTVLTSTGTTNTSGVVIFTHTVSTAKYGKGTYTVTATATKTGYTSGTGTTTFIVN